VALEKIARAPSHPSDIRQDLRCTMKYLLRYGAVQRDAFKAFNQNERLEQYQFQTPYISRAQLASNYQEFKALLRDIGEDHRFGLKLKKKLAVDCVKQWIHHQANQEQFASSLQQLKKDMIAEVPELKFIRQLRSRLWIVRKIRGLYGWTTTQGELNSLVNRAVKDLNNPSTDLGTDAPFFVFKGFFGDCTSPKPEDVPDKDIDSSAVL
jgi:hypothetical protein